MFLVLPIFLYLLHFLLVSVGAGDLQMFLFWVYVPFSLLVSFTLRVIEGN